MIFNLPNPIPETVKDPADIIAFFDQYRVVPYYGLDESTSHTMLDLLQTLTSLSPTYKSVTKDIVFYTFGSNAEIVGRARPGISLEPVELSPEEQIRYQAWLSERNITTRNLIKAFRRIDLHQEASGNAYLVIRRIQVGETTRYDFMVPHYKHCAYLAPRETDPEPFDFLIISKFLGDIEKMKKFPPTVLAATQEGERITWNTTDQANEEKAVIHFKKENHDDESDYYARPDILSVLTWLYTEYQLGTQSSKVSATDLITKIILAFQAPDPNTMPEEDPDDDLPEIGANGWIGKGSKDYFERNMMVLKQLTSNLGRHPAAQDYGDAAASIAGVEYPFSGVPPTSIPLDMNRDTTHHQWQSDQAIGHICQVLRWAPELTSVRQTKTNLGGNLLYDIFTMKNETVINPKQERYQDSINDILAQILERDGGPSEFDNYGFQFPDIISEMIEKFKGAGSTTTADPRTAEEGTQTPGEQLNELSDGNDDNDA